MNTLRQDNMTIDNGHSSPTAREGWGREVRVREIVTLRGSLILFTNIPPKKRFFASKPKVARMSCGELTCTEPFRSAEADNTRVLLPPRVKRSGASISNGSECTSLHIHVLHCGFRFLQEDHGESRGGHP